MQEYTIREFADILAANGYIDNRHSSNHHVFTKEGCKDHITVSFHGRYINPCIARRLIKENNLIL
jgi:predicted RNA binding protein YcfA (HicA-like mRNA interferase family)